MFVKEALAFDINPSLIGLAAFPSLGSLVSQILPVVISLSGLLLFAYLIMGGLKYLTSGGDDKSIGEAKKILTNAIIGMVIVFTAFWVLRIMETILGLNISGYNP